MFLTFSQVNSQNLHLQLLHNVNLIPMLYYSQYTGVSSSNHGTSSVTIRYLNKPVLIKNHDPNVMQQFIIST